MSKLPKRIMHLLEEARKAATMEDASFGFPNDNVKATAHFEEDFDGHPDKYIKDKTRLYRQTWIIGRIDQVIDWANS